MVAPQQDPIVLYAEQEHSGIRLTIFVTLFVGLLAGFRLINVSLEAFAPRSVVDYAVFLSCAGSIPFALLIIWALEKVLKRYWHSGLSLILDRRGLTIHDRRDNKKALPATEPAMLWAANMSQLRWFFKVSGYARGGRERRISAKWFCLAAELQQDESRLSVFTFMSPESAAVWTSNPKKGFHSINLAEIHDSSVRSRMGPPTRPTLPQHVLQTKEARYWLAERRRWEFGIELSLADFETLLRTADQATADPVAPTI